MKQFLFSITIIIFTLSFIGCSSSMLIEDDQNSFIIDDVKVINLYEGNCYISSGDATDKDYDGAYNTALDKARGKITRFLGRDVRGSYTYRKDIKTTGGYTTIKVVVIAPWFYNNFKK